MKKAGLKLLMSVFTALVGALCLMACGDDLPPVACADPAHEGLECLRVPNLRGVCSAGQCAPIPCANNADCDDDPLAPCDVAKCTIPAGAKLGTCGTVDAPDGTWCTTQTVQNGKCVTGRCGAPL